MSTRLRHVAIAGGGLAGIAAAIRLADAGVRVTLIESRQKLGGRATSHTDPATGQLIDNCQHVAMGCCERYIALMDRLGVLDEFEWSEAQHWVESGGRVSVIGPGGLPEPLHLAVSFARAAFLSWSSKLAIARGVVGLKLLNPNDWTGRTFAEWLSSIDQPDEAVARFWEPVVVSACNLSVRHVAAPVAMKVFREGLLAGRKGARIGVPRVPLKTLYDGVERILHESGGRLRLRESVERVRAGAIDTDRARIEADAVICALPIERAWRVLDQRDARVPAMKAARYSPIIGIKMWLRAPVFHWPHAVLVGRSVQWLFPVRDGEAEGGTAPDGVEAIQDWRSGAGRWPVHAVISAAAETVDRSAECIIEDATVDLASCFPEFRRADVLSATVIKEKRATFAATPAFEAFRSGLTVGCRSNPGVWLAGDFTDTGWPATMEGAVRSGELAADRVIPNKMRTDH